MGCGWTARRESAATTTESKTIAGLVDPKAPAAGLAGPLDRIFIWR